MVCNRRSQYQDPMETSSRRSPHVSVTFRKRKYRPILRTRLIFVEVLIHRRDTKMHVQRSGFDRARFCAASVDRSATRTVKTSIPATTGKNGSSKPRPKVLRHQRDEAIVVAINLLKKINEFCSSTTKPFPEPKKIPRVPTAWTLPPSLRNLSLHPKSPLVCNPTRLTTRCKVQVTDFFFNSLILLVVLSTKHGEKSLNSTRSQCQCFFLKNKIIFTY